jgi:hypothetical protein
MAVSAASVDECSLELRDQVTKTETPVPAALIGVAEGRRADELRDLHHRRELIQQQLRRSMPQFASMRATWEPQRQQLQAALDEADASIAAISQLAGNALAQRFAPAELAGLTARQNAGTAEPARLSHDAVEARNFMRRWNERRKLDAGERIVMDGTGA